jgi:hypothetical protein
LSYVKFGTFGTHRFGRLLNKKFLAKVFGQSLEVSKLLNLERASSDYLGKVETQIKIIS